MEIDAYFPWSDAKETAGKAGKITLYLQKGLFFLMQNRLEDYFPMSRNKPYDS